MLISKVLKLRYKVLTCQTPVVSEEAKSSITSNQPPEMPGRSPTQQEGNPGANERRLRGRRPSRRGAGPPPPPEDPRGLRFQPGPGSGPRRNSLWTSRGPLNPSKPPRRPAAGPVRGRRVAHRLPGPQRTRAPPATARGGAHLEADTGAAGSHQNNTAASARPGGRGRASGLGALLTGTRLRGGAPAWGGFPTTQPPLRSRPEGGSKFDPRRDRLHPGSRSSLP